MLVHNNVTNGAREAEKRRIWQIWQIRPRRRPDYIRCEKAEGAHVLFERTTRTETGRSWWDNKSQQALHVAKDAEDTRRTSAHITLHLSSPRPCAGTRS